MMTSSSARVSLGLCVTFLLALAGCDLTRTSGGGGSGGGGASGTNILRGSDGIDLYSYYKGPVKVGSTYKSMEQITFTQQGGDYDPAISPDGQKLIFASTARSVEPHIFMKGVASSTITQLTSPSTPDVLEIQPCFSPDGKLFAYTSNRRGKWGIYIQPLEGSSASTSLTQDLKSDAISPCWHPGGEWLAFSLFNPRNAEWTIAVKKLKTGQIKYLNVEGLYPKFSPDGKRLAYQAARSREPRWYSLWVMDILDDDFNNISAPTEIVSSANWAAINPAWSPDGKYLAFATVHESPEAQSTRRILMGDDIWVVNLNGQDLTRLTTSPDPESHPVWARGKDGKNGRIYFCSMEAGPKNIWALTEPKLPETYGSVAGPLPGPTPPNAPKRVEPPEGAPPEKAPEPASAPPAAKVEAPARLPEPPPPATAKPE